MRSFIVLKDVTVALDDVIGYGIGEYHTEEENYFMLSIWLSGVSNPIVSIYETVEARDKDREFLTNTLSTWNNPN